MTLSKKSFLITAVSAVSTIGIVFLGYYFIYKTDLNAGRLPSFSIGTAVLLILFIGIMLAAIIVIYLHLSVFARITAIENQVHHIIEKDDLDILIPVKGKDELALLSEKINRLVTVKKISEKALRESENLYKSVFQSSGDAFVILDYHLKPIYINKKFSDIFGYTSADLEEKQFVKLLHPGGTRTNLLNLYNECLNRPIGPITAAAYRKSGEKIDIDIVSTPVTLKEKPFVLVRYTDITEIKKLEAEAREHQLQLQQADKLASLGLLVAGVAHEINNPNTFITVNIPYIKKYFEEIFPVLDEYAKVNPDFMIGKLTYAAFKDDINDLLDDLYEGAKRITNIVNDLKNFAKVDTEFKVETINLNEIISYTLRLLAPQIKRKKTLMKARSEKEYFIEANKQKLGQVILNILSNSLDAVDEESGEIEIDFEQNKNGDLICAIRDNGCGIPAEKLDLVFNPFFTTKTSSGGTGLGLSVSRGLMESMNFGISLNSSVEVGTTVYLKFPKEYCK